MDTLFSHFDLMGRNIKKFTISFLEAFVLHVQVLFAFLKYIHSYKSVAKKTLTKIKLVRFVVVHALQMNVLLLCLQIVGLYKQNKAVRCLGPCHLQNLFPLITNIKQTKKWEIHFSSFSTFIGHDALSLRQQRKMTLLCAVSTI